jgi:alpha-N-acetylglucosaminidase
VTLDYYAIEEPWTLRHNPYTAAPEGSPVDIAHEVMELIK